MSSATNPSTKVCASCGARKRVEEFYRHPKGRGGRYHECKECVRARRRNEYATRPSRFAERKRAYYAADRRRVLKRNEAWRKANRVAVNRSNQARYWSDVERARRAHARAAYMRRARKRAGWVEDVDRLVVFDRDEGVCGICGLPVLGAFDVDHIMPLSRGGEHSYANVQLAHPSCNRSKGARAA